MLNKKNIHLSLVFIVVIITMYIANRISADGFFNVFVIKSTEFLEIFPWRFITYVFYFPENPFFFLFTVLIFFLFATNLEALWGSLHFGLFLLLTITSRSIASFLFGATLPIMDKMALYTSLMVAFGFNFPQEKIYLFFFIPIRIKILAIISLVFIGIQLTNSLTFPIMLNIVKDLPLDSENQKIIQSIYSEFIKNYHYGLIKLPPNISLFLVTNLSYIALAIYFKKIFGENHFKNLFRRIKRKQNDINNLNNINILKGMNKSFLKNKFDAKEFSENKEFKLIDEKFIIHDENKEIDEKDSEPLHLCNPEDFDKDDAYCLSCKGYKQCLDREIK